jgi:PAS domain S-box-containing protein
MWQEWWRSLQQWQPYYGLVLPKALEHAVSGISRLDAAGRYIYVNQAYASMVGYRPEDLLGVEWQQTVHSDDLEILLAAYQRMQQNDKVEVDARGIRQDGSVFYKHLVMLPIHDDQHQFIGHHCFMKDVTEAKLAESI